MKLNEKLAIVFLFILNATVSEAIDISREANLLIEEGNRYYQNKEYDKAVDRLQKAIHIDDNNAAAYAKLGATYVTLLKYREAIPYLQKAIEIKAGNLNDSSRSFTYINLVNACLNLGDIERAKDWAQRAVQSNQDNVTVYELIASYYGSKGDYQQGIPYLEEGIKLNPGSISTLILLGTMYIGKGIKDKNESELERGKIHALKAKALLQEKGWNEKDLKRIEQTLKNLDEYELQLRK